MKGSDAAGEDAKAKQYWGTTEAQQKQCTRPRFAVRALTHVIEAGSMSPRTDGPPRVGSSFSRSDRALAAMVLEEMIG